MSTRTPASTGAVLLGLAFIVVLGVVLVVLAGDGKGGFDGVV